MIYIVYLTINTINRKIYVGVHSTEDNIFDGYIGNGINIYRPSTNSFPKTAFQRAVKKYGFNAFQRITLFRCDTMKEALEIEAIIVDEKFLKRGDVYNMKLGGEVTPDCSKEIHQYDLNGKFMASYKSIEVAARELGCSPMSISYAHINNTISFNCLWSTEKQEELNILEYKNIPQDKIIYKYDISGKYLSYYRNSTEASKELNIEARTVRANAVLNYKTGKYYISYEKFDVLPIKERETKINVPVYQYELNGKFIREFSSVKNVTEELGIDKKGLTTYINRSGSYKGFQWSYTKLDSMENVEAKSKSSLPKRISQYTKEGELVKIWDTFSECREHFPNVRKVLSGITSQCKGFVFKYTD